MKQKTVVMWRNRFSGETGFVKSVSKARGYFTNTYDQAEAKSYRSMKDVQRDLELIRSFGEFDQNMFESITINV